MTDVKKLLNEGLLPAVKGDGFWERCLAEIAGGDSSIALHLAIFVEPFLGLALAGTKTVESRFSKRRTAPYNLVREGDVILLKRSGGPVRGLAQIGGVSFYRLDGAALKSIRGEHAEAICATDDEFWEKKQSANYATIMGLSRVRAIAPLDLSSLNFSKRDKRGWVVLSGDGTQLGLL